MLKSIYEGIREKFNASSLSKGVGGREVAFLSKRIRRGRDTTPTGSDHQPWQDEDFRNDDEKWDVIAKAG